MLRLTCPCGATGEFDGVVTSITVGRAERAGWKVSGGPLIKVEENREGLCPACQT